MTSVFHQSQGTPRPALWETAILILATIHVLTYALLVPPWYHYDEPSSLEYALLIRDLGHLPSYDEHIPANRELIAASLRRSPLFATIFAADEPGDSTLSLGFNQRVHPPLYYGLVALILLPVRDRPIETQLLLARLGSVALAAVCFYLALWALRLLIIAVEVRLFAALLLALLPPFADIMSAVNSDVLSNTIAVGLLLTALSLLHRPSRTALWILIIIIIAVPGVKRVLIGPALITLTALALSRLARTRRARHTIAVAGVALLGASAMLVALLPQRLADWSPIPAEAEVIAAPPEHTDQNRRSFRLERSDEGAGPMVEQMIDLHLVRAAHGRVVTLMARVNTSRPGLITPSPSLQIDQQVHLDHTISGVGWNIVSTSAYVPLETRTMIVRLHGPYVPGTIWYDDLVLVIDHAPSALLPDGAIEADLLTADVAPNLIRNPGAERMVPDLARLVPVAAQPWFERRTVAQMVARIFDPTWQLAVYPTQLWELFRGFWGVFSWGEQTIEGGWLIAIGLVVTSGMAGALLLSVRLAVGSGSALLHTADSWWLCLGLVLGVWAIAVVRVTLQPVPGMLIWGFGRYTYVAVLPGLALLALGLASLFPMALRRQGLVGIGIFIGIYALIAMRSILI